MSGPEITAPVAEPFVERHDCAELELGGMTWRKSAAGTRGPVGPYTWSCGNSWLDAAGALHLVLEKTATGWTGAELYTSRPLGFGHYAVHVKSATDALPAGAVFGFFHYLGPGLEREIDVELSRFGGTGAPLWYTVWPERQTTVRGNSWSSDPGSALAGPTTHAYDWSAREVSFRSARGGDETGATIASWRYAPADAALLVPQVAMPLYFNLWVKNEAAMGTATRVEVVVSRVTAPL